MKNGKQERDVRIFFAALSPFIAEYSEAVRSIPLLAAFIFLSDIVSSCPKYGAFCTGKLH
jgi:hypothetical protein